MAARSRWLVVAAALILLATAGTTWAQTRSEISGVIKDDTGGVLPGVTVTLSSPNMVGGAQTAVTDARGVYRFSDLPPGVYAVDATLQGFRTVNRTQLQVDFGTTVTVDLVMQVGNVEETVTVTGDTPVIDVKTAASTTKVDNELLQSLPVGGRSDRPNEVFALAPGVTTNRTAHGGARDANNLLVDGMSSSVPGGNIRTSILNFNWMQEVQVVALGANAEYGEFTGTISNMIMRSGSNNFSGLFEYTTTRQSWLGDNTGGLDPSLQAKFTPAEIDTLWDLSYQGGGPLVKDKLFFFAGGQYYRNGSVTAGALPGPDGKPVPSQERWKRYVGKINWAAANSVKVEAFVEHDLDAMETYGTRTNLDASAQYSGDLPKTMYSARLTWTANDKTLVEIRGGGLSFTQEFMPLPPNTIDGPYAHTDTVWGYSWGNYTGFSRQKQPRQNVSGSVTRWVDGVAGKSHELKLGGEFVRTEIYNWSGYAGGRLYSDKGGVPNQVTLWDGQTVDGISTRVSLFAQDAWQLTDRIILEPGVRIGLNRGSIPGESGVFSTNPVDPRIGFAWDLRGDHRTLLRGHYGRFHEDVSPQMFNFLDFSDWSPKITAKVLADGSFQELNRSVMPGNLSIDTNLKQANLDQFTVALEHELFPDFGITAQFVRRTWGDIFAFVDTASTWTPISKQDPGPDNVAGTPDDGAMLTVYNLDNPGQSVLVFSNPSDATRRYTAFMLIAQKRFSHNWQLLVSYTRSKGIGNVNNFKNNNIGTGPDVGQTGAWANPNVLINAWGPGQFDVPNQFVLNGTYRLPYYGGFNISGTYRYASGAPYGRTATIRGLSQGNQTVRVEPRGAYTADPLNQLDVRFEKTFRVPSLGASGGTAGIYVDVFNALNHGSAQAVTESSGSSYGVPSAWASARQAGLGLRFSF